MMQYVLVPGLGQYIVFSAVHASVRGVKTIVSGHAFQLHIFIAIRPGPKHADEIVMAAQHSANLWHRRLEDMNIDSNGVDHTGDVTDCSACAVAKVSCKPVQKPRLTTSLLPRSC